ncbi:MAG TPA: class I SAM-dependent methyltransferase [Myxococcota bacterium]|nr:class I SAM-dependent methyltransferase [Myxococcota bacterium]
MSTKLDQAQRRIEQAKSEFARLARFAVPSIERALTEFGDEWRLDFAELIASGYEDESDRVAAIRGYAAFAIDSMRRQRRFEETREYPAKTYAEAAAEVYFNDSYMESQYLPGLLLSHYLWPHHYQQLRFFKQFFVPLIAATNTPTASRFAEVGVGTGIYSRTALQLAPEATGIGYDISQVSARFAARHVERHGKGARYGVEVRDVLSEPPDERFDQVICVEVLEHLEDPVSLLVGLRRLVKPEGRLFVTAALNAANADHIHLYRTPADVLRQLEEAELYVEHFFFANAYPPARPQLPVPAAIALVARPMTRPGGTSGGASPSPGPTGSR